MEIALAVFASVQEAQAREDGSEPGSRLALDARRLHEVRRRLGWEERPTLAPENKCIPRRRRKRVHVTASARSGRTEHEPTIWRPAGTGVTEQVFLKESRNLVVAADAAASQRIRGNGASPMTRKCAIENVQRTIVYRGAFARLTELAACICEKCLYFSRTG